MYGQFFQQIQLQGYLSRYVFYKTHIFPCQSLLLNTTVLNDTIYGIVHVDNIVPRLLFSCDLCMTRVDMIISMMLVIYRK